jgi:hypothetical protein
MSVGTEGSALRQHTILDADRRLTKIAAGPHFDYEGRAVGRDVNHHVAVGGEAERLGDDEVGGRLDGG